MDYFCIFLLSQVLYCNTVISYNPQHHDFSVLVLCCPFLIFDTKWSLMVIQVGSCTFVNGKIKNKCINTESSTTTPLMNGCSKTTGVSSTDMLHHPSDVDFTLHICIDTSVCLKFPNSSFQTPWAAFSSWWISCLCHRFGKRCMAKWSLGKSGKVKCTRTNIPCCAKCTWTVTTSPSFLNVFSASLGLIYLFSHTYSFISSWLQHASTKYPCKLSHLEDSLLQNCKWPVEDEVIGPHTQDQLLGWRGSTYWLVHWRHW